MRVFVVSLSVASSCIAAHFAFYFVLVLSVYFNHKQIKLNATLDYSWCNWNTTCLKKCSPFADGVCLYDLFGFKSGISDRNPVSDRSFIPPNESSVLNFIWSTN